MASVPGPLYVWRSTALSRRPRVGAARRRSHSRGSASTRACSRSALPKPAPLHAPPRHFEIRNSCLRATHRQAKFEIETGARSLHPRIALIMQRPLMYSPSSVPCQPSAICYPPFARSHEPGTSLPSFQFPPPASARVRRRSRWRGGASRRACSRSLLPALAHPWPRRWQFAIRNSCLRATHRQAKFAIETGAPLSALGSRSPHSAFRNPQFEIETGSRLRWQIRNSPFEIRNRIGQWSCGQ